MESTLEEIEKFATKLERAGERVFKFACNAELKLGGDVHRLARSTVEHGKISNAQSCTMIWCGVTETAIGRKCEPRIHSPKTSRALPPVSNARLPRVGALGAPFYERIDASLGPPQEGQPLST